jgi:protoporphyrin/coproporphyrin ferrochelatase
MTQRRIALIAINLGGPDGPEAVQPFLFNLFNDPAIISIPGFIRTPLASLISKRRAPESRKNYAMMGGGSPLLPETLLQTAALETAVRSRVGGDVEVKTFVAMRYWKPFTEDAAAAALAWGATEAVVVPLYPQFSSTTTGSSLKAWKAAFSPPTRTLCCYPTVHGFAQAHAEAIIAAWREGGEPANPRVLFSAHGLPQKTVDKGDPYQWQVEQTVAAVRPLLPPEWDKQICYQSRVGPLKWIGPATEDEIERAGREGVGLIVSPIAFVSEHVETLVELDIEYGEKAHEAGVPFYLRAKALGASPLYIDALADKVAGVISSGPDLQSEAGGRICPAKFGMCPHRSAA